MDQEGRTMAEQARIGGGSRGLWRIPVWGGAAALLLAPAIAMRFTGEVAWDETDFLVFGAMLAMAVGAVELAVRASGSLAYRAAAGIAIAAAFLTIWANLAVGMIGSEDNPLNLMFAGVIGLAILGALLARFRPGGMARAMAAAAAAQLVAAGIGLSSDSRGAVLSACFALPWLLSAALFRRASLE